MIITMQDYDEIRRRFLAGESQRHIAKAMGISKNTVKIYCEIYYIMDYGLFGIRFLFSGYKNGAAAP